ncbi:MAG: hypothetical protein ACYDDI_05415 [Candidatus Acidiferrales bacterium]
MKSSRAAAKVRKIMVLRDGRGVRNGFRDGAEGANPAAACFAEEFPTAMRETAHLCGDEIYVALQSSRPFGGGVSAYDGHIISAN